MSWNNFGTPPNKSYEKFFKALFEIESINVSEWKPKHFVGYICKKYYETYNVVFKLSCGTRAPSKCREVHEINRIRYLLSSDNLIIKEYIDWCFETQIKKKKRRVTSFRFLTIESIVLEYKNNVLMNFGDKNIDRTTPLPKDIIDIMKLFNVQYLTFGELALLYYDQDENTRKMFNKLKDVGIDANILNKVV